MKVLLALTDVLAHGGIQRFNRTLLAAMDSLGYQATVLSLNDATGQDGRIPEAPGVALVGFGRSKLAFSAGISSYVSRIKPDALVIGHIHFARLIAAVGRLPFSYTASRRLLIAHGLEVWSSIHGRTRRAVGASTDIVSVSSYTQDMILRQAPELATKRLHIFPNALSSSWTNRVSGPSAAPLPDGVRQPFLLSVSRLGASERAKGIATTIEAFSMLRDREVQYVVAGGGDDMTFLRSIAERLGVAGRVRFVGMPSDDELASLYRHCAAFVLPSGQEGFGIVFLEAMYFGAPVICASEKGALDVVTDGVTGATVPFGDVVRLAETLDRVLADPGYRERLRAGGEGLVRDRGRFTFHAFRQRTAALLTGEDGERAAS